MKNEIIAAYQDSISQLERIFEKVNPVLDGNQWLVEIDRPAVNGFEAYPAMLGEWPAAIGSDKTVRGFRSSELVPNTLCGAILKDGHHAGALVDELRATGHPEARMVPYRVFLRRRLEVQKARLVELLK